MPATVPALPYDILMSICEAVTHRQTLAACSLVCRTFREAAQPSLYRDIMFHDTDGEDGVFGVIEAHPHLRGYVRSAKHISQSSFGSLRDDARDPLFEDKPTVCEKKLKQWANPLSQLYNLHSYTLCPGPPLHIVEPANFDFLLCVSLVLSRLSKLKRVHFAVDLDRMSMPVFTGLLLQGQLSSVTFGKAETGALAHLSKVPDMIQAFSTMREMHILEMGGIDTHELQEIRPLLCHLTHLTFGPGHHLAKDVLLEAFLDIPQLEELSIFYDNFLNSTIDIKHFLLNPHPARDRGLPSLRRLTIQHQGVGTAYQFAELFSWIDALCVHSPLESLEIHSDDGKRSPFDHTILETLRRKRATLRRLVMPRVLIRREVLHPFLCMMRLEEVRVGVDRPKVVPVLDKIPEPYL